MTVYEIRTVDGATLHSSDNPLEARNFDKQLGFAIVPVPASPVFATGNMVGQAREQLVAGNATPCFVNVVQIAWVREHPRR